MFTVGQKVVEHTDVCTILKVFRIAFRTDQPAVKVSFSFAGNSKLVSKFMSHDLGIFNGHEAVVQMHLAEERSVIPGYGSFCKEVAQSNRFSAACPLRVVYFQK